MANAIRDENRVPVLMGTDDVTGLPSPILVDSNGNLLVIGTIADATVPNGGTGVTSFTAYAPIFGGTTSTGALQSGTVGTSGQVLTSNGAGALPTFQTLSAGTVTSVSVTTANGVSGSVATATTTPAITLTLGAITPTSVNKVTITAPATGSTLTIAEGKTLTANNSITIAGVDGKTLTQNVSMTLTAADDTGVYTFPTGTKTLVATDVATLSSLVSIGTITTGVWNGTDIAVADGGTGLSSTTAYAVLCGGTTSTSALQSIASVGTSGQVLTSNGAGALPTFQTASSGGSDLFSTTNMTFTGQFVASAMAITVSGSGAVSNDSAFANVLVLSTGATGSSTAIASVRTAEDGRGFYGYHKDMSFRILGAFGTAQATNFKSYIYAMASAVPPTSATSYAGIRLENATIYAVSKDGTTEESTNITSSFGTIIRDNHCIDIIFTSGTSVVFKVDGATVATHSTNIPLAANTTSEWIPISLEVLNAGSASDCNMKVTNYVWQREF